MNALDTTMVQEAELARSKTEAYAATFRKLAPPVFTDLAEERRHRKERLAGGFRIFAACGFSEGVCGAHHRARPGVHRHLLGQSVRHALRADPGVGPDPGRCRGPVVEGDRPVNVAAFAIHAAIHEARPEVVAAAHAHSIYGKAWSAVGRVLDPITQDACAFYEDHVFFDDTRVLITEASEGAELARCLGPHKGAILRNHGLLTVGGTVEEAVWWFISMERCCQAQFLAESVGTPLQVDAANARAARGVNGSSFAGWFQCQPLWDRVLREQPDSAGLRRKAAAPGSRRVRGSRGAPVRKAARPIRWAPIGAVAIMKRKTKSASTTCSHVSA